VVHVSDSTVIVTLRLRPRDEDVEAAEVHLLLGPTRAVELETLMLELRGVCGFRLQIRNILLIPVRESASFAERFLSESAALFGSLETLLEPSRELRRDDGRSVVDEKILSGVERRKAVKALLYIHALRRRCGALIEEGILRDCCPRMRALIDQELTEVEAEYPMASVTTDIKALTGRIEAFASRAGNLLHRHLLCTNGRLSDAQVEALRELVQTFHSAAVSTIALHESPEAGEGIKLGVIKFLIDKNGVMADCLRPGLQCVGLTLDCSLLLVQENRFLQMTDWYSRSLVLNIKGWLSRNLEHVNRTKEYISLPWDYEQLNELCTSVLPETFQYQLSVFFELCTTLVLNRDDGSQRNKRNKQLLLLNEKIVSAVGSSLELLAAEYARALQAKHWGGADSEEALLNLRFLMSVANDSLRIQTEHTRPMGEVQTTSAGGCEAAIKSVFVAFEKVRTDALRRLARLLFGELQEYLSGFELQWSKSTNNVLVGTILATLEDYFTDLQRNLDVRNFVSLLNTCCGICIARYLLFLRERCAKKLALSSEEMVKLADDVIRVRKSFKRWISRAERASGALDDELGRDMDRCLKFLGDVQQLLTLRPVSNLRIAVVALLSSYPGELHHIAGGVLKLLTLRPDYDLETINMVAAEERKYSTSAEQRTDSHDEHDCDLFVRVFGGLVSEEAPIITPHKLPRQDPLKVIREIAADFSLTPHSLRYRDEVHRLDVERMVGLRTTVSRTSSEGDLQQQQESIRSDDLCMVFVADVRVRGLSSGSLLGLCNPYVVVSLGEARAKTSVQWNRRVDAAWQGEMLSVRVSGARLAASSLRVEVFDKERIRRKKLIGDVTVRLSGLDVHDINSWFALNCESVKGCEIHLSLRLQATS
jgi:hypothetical protein